MRNRGIDILTTHEVDNRGKPDEEQLAFVHEQIRVLVTQDDDFLTLAKAGIEHSGIVYYKPQTCTLKEIIRGLILIHAVLSSDEMNNHIEFL